ncbi:hypothetical protein FZC74_10510 [Sutcliffiella horikoshii]|uniref:Uncharacterized protein n=1 Tax=Sutcliffiella horikoshii TaxID=79883 RepID=A0AA94WT36_9BACI|nr:hypothetical protein FZC74_10510 [Sutcliffiella horikoshii]
MLRIFFVRCIAVEAFLVLRGSSDNVETPQGTEEAQGRPAESEAIWGNHQRCNEDRKGVSVG